MGKTFLYTTFLQDIDSSSNIPSVPYDLTDGFLRSLKVCSHIPFLKGFFSPLPPEYPGDIESRKETKMMNELKRKNFMSNIKFLTTAVS